MNVSATHLELFAKVVDLFDERDILLRGKKKTQNMKQGKRTNFTTEKIFFANIWAVYISHVRGFFFSAHKLEEEEGGGGMIT
jgi:hypothetical protein